MDRSACPHCGHLHVFPIDRDDCMRQSVDRGRRRLLVTLTIAVFLAYLVTEMISAHKTYGTWRCAFHNCEPLPPMVPR